MSHFGLNNFDNYSIIATDRCEDFEGIFLSVFPQFPHMHFCSLDPVKILNNVQNSLGFLILRILSKISCLISDFFKEENIGTEANKKKVFWASEKWWILIYFMINLFLKTKNVHISDSKEEYSNEEDSKEVPYAVFF